MTLSEYINEEPLSEEDVAEVRKVAKTRIKVCQRRAFYSIVALLLNCAVVYPFLEGHQYHNYWESFGKYLVLLSMALLVVSVYCVALFWSAWQALRDFENG
jgi:hypothetical protein